MGSPGRVLKSETSTTIFQVDEVLSKGSQDDLLNGLNPGPMTELNFWEAKYIISISECWRYCRRINLESLFEQMSSPTSIQIASILNVLDSAYYPCFRSNNCFLTNCYYRLFLSFCTSFLSDSITFQVNVSPRCCCNERSPRHISPPTSSEAPYSG